MLLKQSVYIFALYIQDHFSQAAATLDLTMMTQALPADERRVSAAVHRAASYLWTLPNSR